MAWRWTGKQWVKTAEASRDIAGKARVQQTVSITGPASVLIQDQPKTVTFEARVNPQAANEQYGYTWGATGGPGPMTFNSHTSTQSLSATTPGRYDILVHAWNSSTASGFSSRRLRCPSRSRRRHQPRPRGDNFRPRGA